MLIRVMYQDYSYDYVDNRTLDKLITFKRIKKFLRPSEDAWIDIARNTIRGISSNYTGSERRHVQGVT